MEADLKMQGCRQGRCIAPGWVCPLEVTPKVESLWILLLSYDDVRKLEDGCATYRPVDVRRIGQWMCDI